MTAEQEDRKDFWQLCEDAPAYADDVAHLAHWSTNYDHPTPFALFLDIIGYSDEHFGESMFALDNVAERFGFLECNLLGKALIQYGDSPGSVMEFVEDLMSTDEGA